MSDNIIVCGVDPGTASNDPGAISIWKYGKYDVWSWPGYEKSKDIIAMLQEDFEYYCNVYFFIETVASWKGGNRIDSSLKSAGFWEGIVEGYGFQFQNVGARSWQTKLLDSKWYQEDEIKKNPAIKRRYLRAAREHWPELADKLNREKDSGCAAALWICKFGVIQVMEGMKNG